MKLSLSKYIIEVPVKGNGMLQEVDRFLFSTKSSGIIRISKKYLDILRSDNLNAIPDVLFNLLVKHDMLACDALDECATVIQKNISYAKDKESLLATFYIDVDETERQLLFTNICNTIKAELATLKTPQKFTVQLLLAIENNPQKQDWLRKLDECLIDIEANIHIYIFCDQATSFNPFASFAKLKINKVFLFSEHHKGTNTAQQLVDWLHAQQMQGGTSLQPILQCLFLFKNDEFLDDDDKFLLSLKQLANYKNISVEIEVLEKTTPLQQENNLLNLILAYRIKCNILPTPQTHCLTEKKPSFQFGNSNNLNKNIQKLNTDLSWKTNDIKMGFGSFFQYQRAYYQANTLLSRCGQCVFLPVCGGKTSEGLPCPSFIKNIEDRIITSVGMVTTSL